MRRFHSYGPVDCRYHFCVERQALVEQCLSQLVGVPDEGGHYFTIWGPRQTGKTWLMRQAKAEITQRYGEQFTVFNFSFGNLRGMGEGLTGAYLFGSKGKRYAKTSIPGKGDARFQWWQLCSPFPGMLVWPPT